MNKELEMLLIQQLEQNHKLLQENNFLLRQIVKQNNLICTITQKNIRHFSQFYYWFEKAEVVKLKEELEQIYQEALK